jgi:hypothetical protein
LSIPGTDLLSAVKIRVSAPSSSHINGRESAVA